MRVGEEHYRTIWPVEGAPGICRIIDQRELPHRFVTSELRTVDDYSTAIANMAVRGAGLIGATAAYGMSAAAVAAPDDPEGFSNFVEISAEKLKATRPTAKNLEWAVRRQLAAMAESNDVPAKRNAAESGAREIADGDAEACRSIGQHGLGLLRGLQEKKNRAGHGNEPVRILTHCNAGWLAFVDFGSATAPIYAAHDEGLPVQIWVDETRPRNQGAALTAWELGMHGVPHYLVADNAGGHMMQHGLVDVVITGADRVTRTGDAANKIGTYLKALAAADCGIPFYVALPSSTFDWEMRDGVRDIPIEERDPEEVRYCRGLSNETQKPGRVLVCPPSTPAKNYAFDVTPNRLITALITERGVCDASEEAISGLFGDRRVRQ